MPESTLARLQDSPAADRAKEELERYLMAQAERLLAGAGRAMGRSAAHLNAMADGSSPGLKALALDAARKIGKGRGPLRAVIEAGAKQAGEKTANTLRARLGRNGGGPGRGRPTVILESVDVGVPVEDAYNQWIRYRNSCGNRAVHVTEQVPEECIAWTSEGPRGTTHGVVTFHELAVDLTRLLLVVEYHPQGVLEKTADLWRAEGRRVRLDLKDYARFLAFEGGRADGRRGDLHDGADSEEPDEIDAEDTTDLYDDEYEDEAEEVDAADGQAEPEPDWEADPEEEPEASRPAGHRGNRRPA
ncbi:cyclase [Streptomyces sp. NPDC051211]|uniref:cyclase n=1 Tax=Streptomyces sp. NPDC051211 TaxID=3154643 RepID=UPI00344D9CA1